MGRKPWTTDEQGIWLEARKKGFIDAQVDKDTRAFLNATMQAFLKEWPVAEPTAQEIAEEGGLDAARKAKMEAQRVQLEYWFRNHTRNPSAGKGSAKGSSSVLSLARKKIQLLIPYQAYMRLYSKRVMPVIKERYEKYVKVLPEDKTPRNSWPWGCEEATRMLAEDETDAVREEVERFRQELYQEQTPTPLVVEDLMKDGLEDATKKVRSLQHIHNGRTLDLGNMFSEATELWPEIQKAFDAFIAHSFPPQLAEQLEKLHRGENISTSLSVDSDKDSPAPSITTVPAAAAATPAPAPAPAAAVPAAVESATIVPAAIGSAPNDPTPTTSLPLAVTPTAQVPLPSSAAKLSPAQPTANPTTSKPKRTAPRELTYDEMRTLTMHRNEKYLLAIKKGHLAEELQARLDAGEELTTDEEEEWEEPEWMGVAHEHLVGVSQESWWQELVTLWQAFERMLKCPENTHQWLSTKGRPEEVKVWISRARQYSKPPKIKSLPVFVNGWRKWWARLQPPCRREEEINWPLLCCTPDDVSDWSELRRGGCNGVFMVIMCLSWWVANTEELEEVQAAAEDVIWALRAMGCGTPKAPEAAPPSTTISAPVPPPPATPSAPAPMPSAFPTNESSNVAKDVDKEPSATVAAAAADDKSSATPASPSAAPPQELSTTPMNAAVADSTSPGTTVEGVAPPETSPSIAPSSTPPPHPAANAQASTTTPTSKDEGGGDGNGGIGGSGPGEFAGSVAAPLPVTPAKRPSEEGTVGEEHVAKKLKGPAEAGLMSEPASAA